LNGLKQKTFKVCGAWDVYEGRVLMFNTKACAYPIVFMLNVRHAHLESKGDNQFAKSHLQLTFWRKKGTPSINKMSSMFFLHCHAIP